MTDKRKIFVVDTNVLVHDPTSILRFQEHDVVIPIVVLEELDSIKVGMSEVSAAGCTASPNFSWSAWVRVFAASVSSMWAGGGVHMRSERLSQNQGGVTAVPRGGVP